MINFVDKAILELYSNVVSVTIIGENGYEARDDNNEIVTVDSATVEARARELQNEYDNNQYQRDRAKAYPSLKEQMDMQYWDSVNGTTTWKDKIAEIKALYPKPTENN